MTLSAPRIIVLHLDHTTAAGGAELALLRILRQAPLWDATLRLPRGSEPGAGVYAPLLTSVVKVTFGGPAQTYGASGAGVLSQLRFAMSGAGQALTLAVSREFRRSHVVHANTSRSGVYAAAAARVLRKPLVLHLRDIVSVESLGGVGFALLTKFALPGATGVIANSRSTLDSAAPYLRSETQRSVIPSAAGIRDRTPAMNVATDVGRVGMVARIDPWKGQDLLIRAFADAFSGSTVRLILAGGAAFGHDDYLLELKALTESLGISSQVDFLGHVDDVPALLSTLDVCVQASVKPEPLGQNVLQYLAAGKPTVVTREGGPGEWVVDGQNGLLFTLGSLTELSFALRTLAGDRDLRQRLADQAPQTVGLQSDSEVAEAHHQFFVQCLVASERPIA